MDLTNHQYPSAYASNQVTGYPVSASHTQIAQGNQAGVSHTNTEMFQLPYVFDCDGSDSTQELNQEIRIHMIELCKVWFNIPEQAALPINNTLWLRIDRVPTTVQTARTKITFDNVTGTKQEYQGGDPMQSVESVWNNAVAVINVGNVSAGSNVEWENKCRRKIYFRGTSAGVSRLRFTLYQSDGSVYTEIDGERLYIDMDIWGELSF